MGASAIKIAGADVTVTNKSGNNYVDALQVLAAPGRLYKLSVSVLAGAVDVYAWIYDLAAGATTSAAPVAVWYNPAGVSSSWEFGPDGGVFQNGIYVVLSTAAPTDATTTPAATLAGNNKVILKADARRS